MGILLEVALAKIKEQFLTVLVVDSNGTIQAIDAFTEIPSADEIIALGKRYKGHAFKFIPRGQLTTDDIQREIAGLVKTIELGRTGKLKPGANLMKRGHLEWAQDAARRRLLKQKKRSVR